MQVYVKLKQTGKDTVLAVCDVELLGKTFQEGKIVFKVKDDFYNGGKTHVDDAISMIKNANIVNLVGKYCVEKAIQNGYVHPDAVLTIEGVPHAQIVKF
ncbi:MAG: DUF424 family protein [Candidatus Bathyarchaeota archaeon]|nr:DUF424 family protein [Candidatus Termiticorpusculum sp.]